MPRRLFGDADPVDFPEVHRFKVPEGCHWRDVRETPANVGAALSHAMREIERANPDTLYRVFGAADWGNREMLTDEILKDLIEGFSEVSLGNNGGQHGRARRRLRVPDRQVRRRHQQEGRRVLHARAPSSGMMVDILDPKEGETIYDPACGTGGMLLGAIEHVQRARRRPAHLLRQALRPGEEPHHRVHRADEPRPPRHRGLPDRARGHAAQPGVHGLEHRRPRAPSTASSPTRRSRSRSGAATCGKPTRGAAPSSGLPPESYGDYAWVQHMVASMAAEHRPHGSRAAAGRAVPQGRRGQHPHAPARSRT